MYNSTQLASKKTVAEMVSTYNSAIDKVSQAYILLEDAQTELKSTFGEHSYFTVIDGHSGYSSAKENIKNITHGIKKNAWKRIIDMLGIKKLLSISRAEEFDKKLEEGKDLPDITDLNILDMMTSLKDQASDYAKEAVLEVFEYLRPGQREHNNYKTNKKYAQFDLGKKVILSSCIQFSYSHKVPYQANYYRENQLTAIDKVFYMLDGNSWPETYRSPLIDAINTSETGNGETEYFKFKAYNNGNLHLEFKRMDLVQKMNQIAGNGTKLKGKKL